MCAALGTLPHTPLLGSPAEPDTLLAALHAAGIDSFQVCSPEQLKRVPSITQNMVYAIHNRIHRLYTRERGGNRHVTPGVDESHRLQRLACSIRRCYCIVGLRVGSSAAGRCARPQ